MIPVSEKLSLFQFQRCRCVVSWLSQWTDVAGSVCAAPKLLSEFAMGSCEADYRVAGGGSGVPLIRRLSSGAPENAAAAASQACGNEHEVRQRIVTPSRVAERNKRRELMRFSIFSAPIIIPRRTDDSQRVGCREDGHRHDDSTFRY